MCGIAGFVAATKTFAREPIVLAMARTVAHRGPDSEGAWCDEQTGVGLGHQRLSILDLSPMGAQPMLSASGRYVLIFNGEIYNHRELRKLLPIEWRGRSDTETLLAAIETWGLAQALRRCVGMFGLALWDRETRVLSLARDRFGEKPLYYGWSAGSFLFGSELRCLRAFPGFEPKLDWDALQLYVAHGNVPAPWSAFAGVRKLKPGHLLTLQAGESEGSEKIFSYWDVTEAAVAPEFPGSAAEACEELERRLTQSVRGQMLSDVPLGAFLSGGIDSSLIVALMQKESSKPVRTFTIGFEDAGFDESHHAYEVARHIGTQHTSQTITADDAAAWIPRIAEIWDEPFADASQLPTAILSQLTRESVTVSLSGDGGDEMLCGYEHYGAARLIDRIPAKRQVASLLDTLPASMMAGVVRQLPFGFARRVRSRHVELLSDILRQDGRLARYLCQLYQPQASSRLLRARSERYPLNDEAVPDGLDFYPMVALHDIMAYLPNDILVKVDRASMAFGLESRMPFLDHRLVELALSLPASIKVRHGSLKWPLRQIAFKHIPRALLDRPKMGFSVPLGAWLRGPLKAWAEGILLDFPDDELLSQEAVANTWREHSTGSIDHSSLLWKVLMYRSWRIKHAL